MIGPNGNFARHSGDYLFKKVNDLVGAYIKKNGDNGLIALGLGDVSLPLAPEPTKKLAHFSSEMKKVDGFHGYPPYFGYDFLRRAIAKDYAKKGVSVRAEEVFVSDGAKCDIGGLTDLFLKGSDVLVFSPSYPVYVDVNVIAGNTVTIVKTREENGFLPDVSAIEKKAYVIYVCSPNNPTGIVYPPRIMRELVGFALETGSLIVFDGAYSEYIRSDGIKSVYSIDVAKRCAIEVGSFSKRAGFTGLRCGWTVIPETVKIGGIRLSDMWKRRQSTKFNGVCYPVQRAAAAALTEKGRAQCGKQIEYYLKNAKILTDFCKKRGFKLFGGDDSPYIWLKCPKGFDSWSLFDFLLEKAAIITTPGAGFGAGGEGYIRMTAFNTYLNTVEAVERLTAVI